MACSCEWCLGHEESLAVPFTRPASPLAAPSRTALDPGIATWGEQAAPPLTEQELSGLEADVASKALLTRLLAGFLDMRARAGVLDQALDAAGVLRGPTEMRIAGLAGERDALGANLSLARRELATLRASDAARAQAIEQVHASLDDAGAPRGLPEERIAWLAEQRDDAANGAIREISELVGEGGDNTPFGRVESLVADRAHAREEVATLRVERDKARRGCKRLREERDRAIAAAARTLFLEHAREWGEGSNAWVASEIPEDETLAHEEALRAEGRAEAAKLAVDAANHLDGLLSDIGPGHPDEYRRGQRRGYIDAAAIIRRTFSLGAALAAHTPAACLRRAMDHETLGKLVRDAWMRWAREQPDVAEHPSWLVPWDALAERDREVDRRIGGEVASFVLVEGCAGEDLPEVRRWRRRVLGIRRNRWTWMASPVRAAPEAR